MTWTKCRNKECNEEVWTNSNEPCFCSECMILGMDKEYRKDEKSEVSK